MICRRFLAAIALALAPFAAFSVELTATLVASASSAGHVLPQSIPADVLQFEKDFNPAMTSGDVDRVTPFFSLYAGTPEKVRAAYASAIALGAMDEGAPGPRDAIPGFYAAYFRDPDGNKLNVFCLEKASNDV